MSFRNLNDNDLADFAANVATLLGGSELSSINSAARTALAAEMGSLPADLDQQVLVTMTSEDIRKAAVSIKKGMREDILAVLAKVKTALAAGDAPKEEYDLCGFSFRKEPVGAYQAQDPTELSASGFSNGVNRLVFKGNNPAKYVVYEIWRRQGESGGWNPLATTTKQSFTDTPVIPGQYYEYRVRAVAAKTTSNYSNSTVIYGLV